MWRDLIHAAVFLLASVNLLQHSTFFQKKKKNRFKSIFWTRIPKGFPTGTSVTQENIAILQIAIWSLLGVSDKIRKTDKYFSIKMILILNSSLQKITH